MEEKERLTKLNDKLYNNSPISQEYPNEYITKNKRLAINKLAEYENTNLSPEEVEQLKKENEELKSSQNKVAIDYLNKLFDIMTYYGWSDDTNINAMDLYNKMTELIAELKGEKDE